MDLPFAVAAWLGIPTLEAGQDLGSVVFNVRHTQETMNSTVIHVISAF